MDWIVNTAARLDEMSHGKLALRVESHADSDFVLYIDVDGVPLEDAEGNKAQVEFCASGGRSPRTRAAMAELLKALIIDGRADPSGIPPFPFYVKQKMEEVDV